MAKYIVETYYTCTFKVKHYLDDISKNQLNQLDNRDDGEFEILDVKFDKRNTKNLEKKTGQIEVKFNESIENANGNNHANSVKNLVLNNGIKEAATKRFSIQIEERVIFKKHWRPQVYLLWR